MSETRKVFIFNGASAYSAQDLKELFSSKSIFGSQPDVELSDFNFNPSGLSRPIFVVGGGHCFSIGKLKEKFTNIKNTLNGNYTYVGICAGGFGGTNHGDLFTITHKKQDYYYYDALEAPQFCLTTEDIGCNFNFISDYDSIGCFYPDERHLNGDYEGNVVPYCVNIQLNDELETSKLLYVNGPGFVPSQSSSESSSQSNSTSKILATYRDQSFYSFSFPKPETKVFNNLGAMIFKPATDTEGACFLSGAHIEACVANSKFLQLFKSGDKTGLTKYSALPADEYEQLIETQPKSLVRIESLLSRNLR